MADLSKSLGEMKTPSSSDQEKQPDDTAKSKDAAGFRFNFGQEEGSPSVVVETKEAAVLTKKFKFKPSDNDFKFNFS